MSKPHTYGTWKYDTVNPVGRRTDPRVRLKLPAKIMLLGGTSSCPLESLSGGGARIVTDKDLGDDTAGVLKCDGVDAFFTVAWRRGNRFGLEFDENQPDQVLRDVRWHSDHFD